MKNKIEQILEHIAQLDNLIQELCTVIAINDEYFTTFYNSISTIQIQCQFNKNNFSSNCIIDPLIKQLLTLDDYCYTLIINLITRTAKEHSLEWRPDIKPVKPSVKTSSSIDKSLSDHLTTVIEQFKHHAIEANKRYQAQLQQWQASLSHHDSQSPLPGKITSLLTHIEQHPSQLIAVNQLTEIKQRVSRKGVKRHHAIINDNPIPDDAEQTALKPAILLKHAELIACITVHTELARNNYEQHTSVSDDFLIRKQSASYQKKEQQAVTIIDNAKTKMANWLPYPIYHEKLLTELTDMVASLTLLNQQRSHLLTITAKRYRLLVPKTCDCEELECYQYVAFEQLKKDLEDFLINFSMIHLIENDMSHSDFFIKQLTDFVYQLIPKLQALFPDKNNNISQLETMLLHHLGVNTNWLPSWLSTPSAKVDFESDKAHQFLWDLLCIQTKIPLTESVLRQKIASTYDIVALLEDFSLRSIKNYYMYKNSSESQLIILEKNYQELTNIFEEQLAKISRLLALFPSSYEQNLHFAELNKIQTLLLNNQQKILDLYQKNVSNQSLLATNVNPIKHLDTITVQQRKTIEIIKETQQDILRDQPSIDRHITKLTNKYDSEKTLLKDKLIVSFDDAKAALHVCHDDQKDINQLLTPQQTMIDKLATSQDNLAILTDNVNANIQICSNHLATTKQWLITKIEPKINTTRQNLAQFCLIDLTVTNPFYHELAITAQAATSTVTKLTTQYEKLDNIKGISLAIWLEMTNDSWTQAEFDIKVRDETLLAAQKIERRLQTNEYLASIEILTTINAEYLRLINSALTKTPSPAEQELLLTLKNLSFDDLSPETLSTIDKTAVDKIDTRLFKLISIYLDFKATNAQYINKDTKLLSKKTYLDRLINNVNTHLRNEQMERISDGTRPEFFQWIRSNILKPLQKFKHTVTAYLGISRYSNNHFFTTPYPCKTEKALVDLSNQVSERLSPRQVSME